MTFSANLRAFLHMIRVGEGTADPDGYRRHFGGSLFDSFADHPRKVITAGMGKKKYSSSAAGAYQFLTATWDECRAALGLPDFSPESQDKAAVYLIKRRGALEDVEAGRFEQAVKKCAKEWASLPGSPYGQPTKTMAQALATYKQAGGSLDTQSGHEPTQRENNHPLDSPLFSHVEEIDTSSERVQKTPKSEHIPLDPINAPQGEPMAPFIAAAIPALVQAAPDLIRIFGNSENAERNAKAAEVVAQIAVESTASQNVQEAVEQVQASPEQAKAFKEAVQERWFELTEVGGGVQAARKADAEFVAKGESVFKSPSFWVALLLLPLVYMIVANVVGVVGKPLNDEVRSAISNGVVGLVLGGLIGYYYGQTTSRNRT